MIIKENKINLFVIQQMAEKIKEKFKPEKIILFGSYAYGETNNTSDIDLLIIMDTVESFPKVATQIRLYLDENFGVLCPMDILVRTPREIEKRIREGDFFFSTILSKGKPL